MILRTLNSVHLVLIIYNSPFHGSKKIHIKCGWTSGEVWVEKVAFFVNKQQMTALMISICCLSMCLLNILFITEKYCYVKCI
jgi:hypothetical protein